MCSRHDDPSQIDVAEIFAEEESAMKWRYNIVSPAPGEMESILNMAAQYNPRAAWFQVRTMRERDAHRHARYEHYITPGIGKEHTKEIARRRFLNNGRALLSELHYGSPISFTHKYQELI